MIMNRDYKNIINRLVAKVGRDVPIASYSKEDLDG